MAAEAAEGSSLLRKWFRPTVFRERGTAEAAALAYEQAVVESVQTSAAEIAFNVGTACSSGGTERGGVRMPARDFIIASARMRLDNDEPVYVTARWRWAADLEKYTATSHLDRAQCQWVEQRSLRFGDPLDPPENVMIVDRPGICQKPYMRVSFFAMGLLPRPPSRILLIGLGAGHLVEIWRAHLPRIAGTPLEIHCVELHAEVVELARQYFNFGRADDAQTTVTVQVADGREVLEQSPPSTYDLVMVDLSVAGFVDENACSDLRRVLRPGGVCVHNYNFASGQAIPDALPANFSQAHQLVIDASNTILVSTTTKIHDGDDFNKIVDQSVAFPYASPLPFDLRADLETVAHGLLATRGEEEAPAWNTDLDAQCERGMARGNGILQRVQQVGDAFTTQLKECSRCLAEIRSRSTPHDQTSDENREHQSSAHDDPSSTVEAVQQVLLRKVLAVDRGQAATLARSVNAMLDSIADLAEESAEAAPSALAKLAELSALLGTAETRLEKLESRATQLQNGVFEQLVAEGIDDESDSSSDSEKGHEDRDVSTQSRQLRLAELRGGAEAALSEVLSSTSTQRPDEVYSALAQSLTRG